MSIRITGATPVHGRKWKDQSDWSGGWVARSPGKGPVSPLASPIGSRPRLALCRTRGRGGPGVAQRKISLKTARSKGRPGAPEHTSELYCDKILQMPPFKVQTSLAVSERRRVTGHVSVSGPRPSTGWTARTTCPVPCGLEHPPHFPPTLSHLFPELQAAGWALG